MVEMPSCKRRIVRRAVMVVAGCVLLTVWYVGAWLAFVRLCTPVVPGAAWIHQQHPLFAPIDAYIDAELPGSDLLWRMHCVADPNCD